LLLKKKQIEMCNNLIEILYSQAVLIEGGDIQSPNRFAKQLNSIICFIGEKPD
jgi:HSP90 family molecular chaperone